MQEPLSGLRPGRQGLILQRGGEELQLEKALDRLTTRLDSPTDLPPLQTALNPTAVRSVALGQLVEWTFPVSRLEDALSWLRQQPTVRFASHVYHLSLSPQTWLYLTEQITVQFAPEVSLGRIETIAAEAHLRPLHPLSGIPKTYVYELTPQATENPIKLANRLMLLPEVLTAEPNVVVESTALHRPSDDLYPQQWHLFHHGGSNLASNSHIDVERAWDITRGHRSIVIAISDDGFDLNHPDLQGMGKLVMPTDLLDRDASPLPMKTDENHGTATAGLAIGEENGQGIVGVAPGCAFMPIRNTGFLDDISIERLFDSAVAADVAVISCSWSPSTVYFPLTLRQSNAITRAATHGRNGKGCVVVFSAGNANRPIKGTIHEQGWPNQEIHGETAWLNGFVLHPDVIAVSASTSLNRKAAYSNWGQQVAVAAPSNNGPPLVGLPKLGLVSTGPTLGGSLPGKGMVTSDRLQGSGYERGNYTTTFGGTSSSCPVVAGVVGLMLSINPQLTAKEVRQILQVTADKIIDANPDPQLNRQYGAYNQNGHSQWFGYGKVNAYKAVIEAKRRAVSRIIKQPLKLSSQAAVKVPDANPKGIESPIQVSATGRVQDIQIHVELDHAFLGDISLTLIAPDKTEVLLQGRTLGSMTELRTTYSFTTTPALMALLGKPVTGQWGLKAVDHVPNSTGKLHRWDLSLGIG